MADQKLLRYAQNIGYLGPKPNQKGLEEITRVVNILPQIAQAQIYRRNILDDIELTNRLHRMMTKVLQMHYEKIINPKEMASDLKLTSIMQRFQKDIEKYKLHFTQQPQFDGMDVHIKAKQRLFECKSFLMSIITELCRKHFEVISSQSKVFEASEDLQLDLQLIPEIVDELMKPISQTPIQGDTPASFAKFLSVLLLDRDGSSGGVVDSKQLMKLSTENQTLKTELSQKSKANQELSAKIQEMGLEIEELSESNETINLLS
jgi:hypothetical protein